MKIFIFTVYTLFISLISLFAYLNIIPTKEIRIPYYDSIGHFVLYGIWAYLFANVFSKPAVYIRSFAIPWGMIIVSAITIIEEMLQSFSPVRTTSLTDLGCSMLGIMMAGVIFNNRKKITRIT